MVFNSYIYLIIICTIIIFLACAFLWRKKNIPSGLFAEALKNENSGQYEKAVLSYESALNEIKKARFNTTLRNRIAGKIKVLHAVIDYKNRFHTPR